MVEKKGLGKAIGHAFLWFGIAIVLFPLYIALVATTHTFDVLIGSTPLWFGGEFLKNFTTVLTQGLKAAGGIPVWVMMANSLVMALGIAIGKIAISITAAYAIVYFRFPGRELCFVLIFITLMMPVEVRIVPTFQVAANLNFIDSYLGLVLPLIASATATFLYRQMFMTIPAELLEAARIDGAGPWRFFVDVVLPLSRTNTAALFVVLFIYGWNQYLWPLLVTNQESMYTIVMGIQRMVNIPDAVPEWNLIMAVALLGMLPPLLVVLGMFMYLQNSASQVLYMDVASQSHPGSLNLAASLNSMSFNIGIAIGSAVGGLINGHFGLMWLGPVGALFLVCAIAITTFLRPFVAQERDFYADI